MFEFGNCFDCGEFDFIKAKKIIIRSDSSSKIGVGHVMRDLVLAKKLKCSNILFASRDLHGNANFLITQGGFKLKTLNTNDVKEMIDLVRDEKADLVVLDDYEIDYEYEKNLKDATGVKLFVLDDLHKKHYCDYLLNHNIHADENEYKNLVPKDCRVLCGSKYTLIREEFYEAKKKRKEGLKKGDDRLNRIFVSIGGSDPQGLTLKILKALSHLHNSVHCSVATMSSNAKIEEVKRYVAEKKWITLHVNSNNIADIMLNSDLGIISSSSIVNEVIFIGLPFVAIKTSSNQKRMFSFLKENGFLTMEEFDPKILMVFVEKLIESKQIQ